MKKSRQNTLRKKRQAKLTNRNFLQIATDSTEGFFLDLFEKLGLASFVDWYIKKTEATLKLAISALEKQTPKKLKDDGWLYCPICGRDVLMDRFNYCPDCGQALDWSDNND